MATLLLQSTMGMTGQSLVPLVRMARRALPRVVKKLLTPDKVVEGPRLTNLAALASTEGAPIPRVYGRVRIGGQLIWATRFIETQTRTRTGGSGGKSQLVDSGGTEHVTYSYAANFAIGLCEGEIAFMRRIWADGHEIDLTSFTHRLYLGTQDQAADPLIVAKEGADQAPGYRGLAYLVFENFPIGDYGNRIPQLSFEVVKPVAGLARMVRAVNLIPGSSEYAYSVKALVRSDAGVSQSENRHQLFGASDWTASLDALQALCPNLKNVALVVSWFATDFAAGGCAIVPAVETRLKPITGQPWAVAGRNRDTAYLMSQIDGRPAYGGTPSDDVVVGAIADLKARGLNVLFYPFVMMDVPGHYGWRGEIAPLSAEGSAQCDAEIATFFGEDGSAERYRDFILHYADLCVQAGGVETFLLGSELRGLTRALGVDGYAGPRALMRLARDVRTRLGASTKISYSADWSEYGALARDNGATLHFPLDPLWACADIDFIGIDAYFPLSDWREGPAHADRALSDTIYDRAYLRDRLGAGECFDFYYASEAARDAQQRLPITDGLGKPWVWRAKDLVNFWSQPHVEREQGVEKSRPTDWIACSKPIWFVETGCPAMNFGANAPNVFPDTKAALSPVPPFSSGARDDLMQIRTLEAVIARFDPRSPWHRVGDNPVSAQGVRMVDPDRIYIWAYDARPFPAFPMYQTTWTDAGNWHKGHWLNGRLESAPLDDLVRALMQDMTGLSVAQPALDGCADGYVVDRPMSARAALEPLADFYGFDALVTSGKIVFQERSKGAIAEIGDDDLVPQKDGSLITLTRAQDSDLPHEVHVSFTDAEWDYRPASALSRRLEGATRRLAEAEVALVTHRAAAQRAADIWLQDIWIARETASFALRPTRVDIETGDLLRLNVDGAPRLMRVLRIEDSDMRHVECRAVDLSIHDHAVAHVATSSSTLPSLPGQPHVEVLDLALARDDQAVLQYVAAFAEPWPQALSLYRANGDSFQFTGTLTRSAVLGSSLDVIGAGPLGRIDHATRFRVEMRGGALVSVSDDDLLAGRNLLAVAGMDGRWELMGFGRADLVGDGIWQISRLLRGLGGEDSLAARVLPAGARVVKVDEALFPLATGFSALGVTTQWRIGPQKRDPSDASYLTFSATPGGLALKPFAPVRARAKRVAEGVQISFVRRTRRDGDMWEGIDVPLGEASETYVIECLGIDGRVKRSLSSATTSCLYTAADELADFGAPQTLLRVNIAQMSAAVGRGFDLRVDIPVL